MAFVVTDLNPYKSGWALNAVGDASGCEELKAAPGTGLSLYLDQVIIDTTAAATIIIGQGETVPGTPDANIIGPVGFSPNVPVVWKFDKPIKLTANTSLVVDSNVANDVCVWVEGTTR